MTVYIHLVGGRTITLDKTNDIDGIWEKIQKHEKIETGNWDDAMFVNKDNVTNVTKGR